MSSRPNFNVPLLKDIPLIQDLSLNAAGRYTNYSTSGEAQTWKVGIDWHVNDTVRFRGTTSVDIRAPNLNDLFQPVGISSTGFTDLLTTANNSTRLQTQGNAALIPEVARTYTVGMVLTPDFIPGLVFSVDYFQTHLSSAIPLISGQGTAVQQLCINSAPAYDSPLCGLYVRPIAPERGPARSPARPTIRSVRAELAAQCVDRSRSKAGISRSTIPSNWPTLMEELPGSVNFRHLFSYQPVNTTVQLPGAAPTWQVNPKTRQTTFLNYTVGDWGLSLQNQWLSGFKKNNAAITTGSQQLCGAARQLLQRPGRDHRSQVRSVGRRCHHVSHDQQYRRHPRAAEPDQCARTPVCSIRPRRSTTIPVASTPSV